MAAILKSTAATKFANVGATTAQGIVTRCGDWRGGKSVGSAQGAAFTL